MIRFLIKFICVTCVPVFSIGSTLFVGNSGEVFLINKQYFVRDLVEASVHTNPAFNCVISYPDLKAPSPHLEHLDIDMRLFERKLCDVESVYPGIAKFFISAIQMHSWTLVNENLNLLPDDGPLLASTEYERVQAANRTLSNVRLQKQIWSQLDPENRIALIFHEVIFSLLKYDCVDNVCSIYQQSARVAREITGLLFSSNTYHSEYILYRLSQLMREYLNPSKIELTTLEPIQIRISFAYVALSMNKSASETAAEFSNKACHVYIVQKQAGKNIDMHLMTLKKESPNLVTQSYETIYGKEYRLKLSQRNTYTSQKMDDLFDEKTCSDQLTKKISELSE